MSETAPRQVHTRYWLICIVIGLVIGFSMGYLWWKNQMKYTLEATQKIQQKFEQLLVESQKEQQNLSNENMMNLKLLQSEQNKLVLMSQKLSKLKKEYEQGAAQQNEKFKQLMFNVTKLEISKAKLIAELDSVKSSKKKQQVLQNPIALKRLKTVVQTQINAIDNTILKSQQELKKLKKACDEFKSGTSWNRVSQKDCDEYLEQSVKLNANQSTRMNLQKILAELASS